MAECEGANAIAGRTFLQCLVEKGATLDKEKSM